MLRVAPIALCCVLLAFAGRAWSAPSKAEEWHDVQGAVFKGEPTELLGPFAIFRTGLKTGRRVALQLLPPTDCVRLNEALRGRPLRADTWANAKGEATKELVGRLMQVENDQLVRVDFSTRPEPAVLVVIYSANAERFSWDMLTDVDPLFRKLRDSYPGMVEGVMYGVRHNQSEHMNMALSRNVPWLVTAFYDQNLLNSLNRFVPETYSILVLSRDGVPLFLEDHPDTAATTKLFSDVAALLDLSRPENPKAWGPRTHFLNAVRQVEFTQGHADPLLVGNPLMKQGLVQRKVFRFEAEVHVNAEGRVKEVKMLPDDMLPEKMSAPIADGLKNAVFAPAIQDGAFVDGVYLYHFRATK